MGMSLDGISSMLDNASTQAANGTAKGLESKLDSDMSHATDDELMDVCKEFEAYFMEQVYKEMQKTIPENENQDASMSQLTSFYKDQMLQEVTSQSIEQGGNGLAQQLYEQMKRNYDL